RVLDIRRSPDFAQELAVCQYHAQMLRQAGKQPELDRSEVDFGAFAAGATLFEVYLHFSEHQRLTRRGPRGVPQRGAYARQQLSDAEWLGDVVVGAGVEGLDLGLLARARREHDDRHRRPAADAPDDFHAVDVGQPEVDDREIRLVAAGGGGTALAAFRLHHAIAFRGERAAQEPADLRLILDDEHRGARLAHCRAAATSRGICGASSSGKLKRKAAPPEVAPSFRGGRRSAQMLPPCSRTIARQMARPSPTPLTALSGLPR